jgi:hypothetical protein
MVFLNQYSFLVLAALSMIALALYLLRDGMQSGDLTALLALLIGFGLAFVLLSPGDSSLEQVDQVQSAIGSGTPVLLEYQSPY